MTIEASVTVGTSRFELCLPSTNVEGAESLVGNSRLVYFQNDIRVLGFNDGNIQMV